MAVKALTSFSVALAVVSAVCAASAQVGPVGLIQMPPLFGDFKPSTGAWAEYRVHETETDSVMNITVALLGQEKCAAGSPEDRKRDCFWVEVVTQLIDGPSAAVKIYSAGDPRDVKNFRRLLNRAGKRPPVEAKPESLSKLAKIPGGALPESARVLPKKDAVAASGEKILSSISEFRADGVPYVLWSSERVPLFGMVRLQAPNLKIELLKSGRNFKTTFPEVKEVQKKDDVVDKPDPLKISKPGHGAVEEEKGRINEDYGRPGLREREGADDDVE